MSCAEMLVELRDRVGKATTYVQYVVHLNKALQLSDSVLLCALW
jgi:hypothetical protein